MYRERRSAPQGKLRQSRFQIQTFKSQIKTLPAGADFLTIENGSHKLRATAFSANIRFRLPYLLADRAGGRVIGSHTSYSNGLQQNVRGGEADSHFQLLSRRRAQGRALTFQYHRSSERR